MGTVNAEDTQRHERRPRGRRWLIRILVLVVIIVLLIAAGPYLASTRPGTAIVTGAVNHHIRGRVSVDRLSLGWGGPTRIEGLTVHDPHGREVIAASDLTAAGGAWRFLVAPMDFGAVELQSPRVEIHVDADGTPKNLVEAISPRQPPKPRDPQPLPRPVGAVTVRDGRVRVIMHHGRDYHVANLDGRLDVQTLNAITGSFRADLPEAGKVEIGLEINRIADETELRLDRAEGAISATTLEPIAIEPIGRFAGADPPLSGMLEANARLSFGDGHAQGIFDIAARSLQSGLERYLDIRPIDLRLSGSADLSADSLSAAVEFTGPGSRVDGRFAYAMDPQPAAVDIGTIVNAVLQGRGTVLPDMSASLNGDIDLARLAQAVPALLRLRPDVSIVSASIALRDITFQGGPAPAAAGAIAVSDIALVTNGREIAWQPMTAVFNAAMTPEQGLRITDTQLTTGFGEITASGDLQGVAVRYETDLAELHRMLGQIVDLGDITLAGRSEGSLEVLRRSEGRADVSLRATGQSLRLGRSAGAAEISHASLEGRGSITLDRRRADLLVSALELQADDFLDIRGDGRHTTADGVFSGTAYIDAAIAPIITTLADLGVDVPDGFAGRIRGRATFSRPGGEEPIEASGGITAAGLSRHGRAISAEPVHLDIERLQLAPFTTASLARAELRADVATVTAADAQVALGEQATLDGTVSARGDLRGIARALSIATAAADEPIAPPEIDGAFEWDGVARGADDVVTLRGDGSIRAFAAPGAPAQDLTFEHLLTVDPRREVLAIDRFEIAAEMLTVSVDPGSTISRYTGEMLMNVRGSYTADWPGVTALLHELAPALADTVSVAGGSQGTFTVEGPARRADVRPAFRDLRARTSLQWHSAQAMGIPIGAGSLDLSLDDGRIVVPPAEIPASGGVIRVGGAVDLTGEAPMLHLPGETVILDRIEVDREIARELLSRFNPIFANLASLQGTVTLATTDPILLPLSETATGGSGGGTLDLRAIQARPAGLMQSLLALTGVPADRQRQMQIGRVDFRVLDDRIRYDDFTVQVTPAVVMQFAGAVGFDGATDMRVSIPMSPELVRRAGLTLPFAANLLEGLRVDIPITGTRLAPAFSVPRANIQQMLNNVMRNFLRTRPGDRPPPQDPADPPPPQGPTDPDDTASPPSLEDILRQRLEDLFRRPAR